MKIRIAFIFFICVQFIGCTIPCDIFFRNLSDEEVQLKGKLVDRKYFDKLPNRVNFYDTAHKSKQIYGELKFRKLITWIDSNRFHIDIPPHCVVDLSDVSNGLTLGTTSPNVLLIISRSTKVDTLTTGDYSSVVAKFRVKSAFLSKPIYYYDIK
jgi:hypothetical protein